MTVVKTRDRKDLIDGHRRSPGRPDVLCLATVAGRRLRRLPVPPCGINRDDKRLEGVLLHLLQLGEMAIPTLAAIFLEINALVIATMIICLIAHEATAVWDVSYAYSRREVTPTEQHVHSFLEMLPLMGLLIIVTLHWQQFLSLFGLGQETIDFTLRLRQPPLPWLYVSTIFSLVVLFEILPYLEELLRGIRPRKTKPPQG